jgi:hypothetical protein
VALPVLIHLINMLRHRRIEWAAIEFLLLSQKKNRTWVLIKQLILLLLRMLAVAAIVMLVAQPVSRDKWSGLFGADKTHHIILLDDSYSMSSTRGDKDLFDLAKGATRQIVATASDRQSDQAFTLARFSQLASALYEIEELAMAGGKEEPEKPDENAAKPETTDANSGTETTGPKLDEKKSKSIKERRFDFDDAKVDGTTLSALEERLSTMHISESDAGVKEAVHVIETLFAGDGKEENRIIYLITDFRERDWEAGEVIRTALQHLAGKRTRIEFIDCSTKDKTNLTVTDIKPVPGIFAAGVPCFVEVTVKNHGKQPVQNVVVSVEQDGDVSSVDKIEKIAPGKEATKRFAIRFAAPGPHSVAAKIDMDSIVADNRRFLVLDIKDDIPVLVIDGSATREDSENFRWALNPGPAVKTGIKPRVESPSFLTRGTLDHFASICFTDTMSLDDEAIERLERYVAGGGSVVFFTGPKTNTRYVNQKLYRSGQGVFPVKLRVRQELMADALQKLPDIEVAEHPLFRVFDNKESNYLDMLNVYTYMAVEKEEGNELKDVVTDKKTEKNETETENQEGEVRQPPKVIARLRGGAPFIIESTFGKGHVITMLSSIAPVWNNWAKGNPSYVIAVQEMQAYLSRQQEQNLSEYKVGQPLKLELDAQAYNDTISFAIPESKDKKRAKPKELMTTVTATRTDDGRLLASFSDTDTAGVYRIQLTTVKDIDELRKTSVNVEPSEGNLKRFASEELNTTLSGVPYDVTAVSEFDANADDKMGKNLQDIVLILLILMLLVEQILAWSCSYHPPAKGKGGGA